MDEEEEKIVSRVWLVDDMGRIIGAVDRVARKLKQAKSADYREGWQDAMESVCTAFGITPPVGDVWEDDGYDERGFSKLMQG